MPVRDICAQPVAELAQPRAHLHLWTTNGFLREAFDVIAAWGFEYKSCLVWVKDEIGMGNYWRVSHEFLLLGVRGALTFRDRAVRSWVQAPFNFGTWLVHDPTTGQGGDGSFFVNSSTRPASFTDGLSHTLAAAEVKAFTAYFRNTTDPGPTVPTSPSDLSTFAPGAQFKLGPSVNDNTGHTEWADGRVHHSGITTIFTPNTFVGYRHTDGRLYDIDYNSQQEGRSATQRTYAAVTARSYHPAVVNVLMMDGSVRAVSDQVNLSVWRSLGTRAGGERTDTHDF